VAERQTIRFQLRGTKLTLVEAEQIEARLVAAIGLDNLCNETPGGKDIRFLSTSEQVAVRVIPPRTHEQILNHRNGAVNKTAVFVKARDTGIVTRYDSMHDAARATSSTATTIWHALYGTRLRKGNKYRGIGALPLTLNHLLTATNTAAAELLRRRQARRSLALWAELCGFVPAKHHQLIIALLERVTRGEAKRVIIMMPPGAAKSSYASVAFPPWYLAQCPTATILACSYSYTLIESFGKRCRNIIDNHGPILGYALSKHSQAAGDWETNKGGRYFCAGVGAGIAGHRADLAFIDDYLGSEEDANSKLIRDKQWDWYNNDLWPRLKPQAAVVIIANRRHEDDLIGRILEKEAAKWRLYVCRFLPKRTIL